MARCIEYPKQRVWETAEYVKWKRARNANNGSGRAGGDSDRPPQRFKDPSDDEWLDLLKDCPEPPIVTLSISMFDCTDPKTGRQAAHKGFLRTAGLLAQCCIRAQFNYVADDAQCPKDGENLPQWKRDLPPREGSVAVALVKSGHRSLGGHEGGNGMVSRRTSAVSPAGLASPAIIAHEIGHNAGIGQHTSHGVMKGTVGSNDVFFTAEQCDQLRTLGK